ncbi:MAG: hypothetical protein EOM06_00960 [Sphingobacteriia bacterium]|nr:hypothetical protein [Sphingobacteriia bacterium]
MKKLVLLFSLAFAIAAAFFVVTKTQYANTTGSELAFFADDAIDAYTFNDDEPKKAEAKKGTSNSKCPSSANCDKTKCAGKSDAGVKNDCCTDKNKTTTGNPGKSVCCSKEKAIQETDKK